MKKGLVSVTFRGLDCGGIIEFSVGAGLKYIEWGGDIHIPAGDDATALRVNVLSSLAGLKSVGYGSYYNAAASIDRFYPNLNTARALGAEYIRIWAGKSKEYDNNAAENIKTAVCAAVKYGISVSLECHRGTMTEDAEQAVKLARNFGCKLHFQPNPDVSFDENLNTVRAFAPYLCACHVFAWDKGDIRKPLSEQKDEWIEYAKEAPDVPFLLEFVMGDTLNQAYDDAATLGEILKKAGKH